jgi:hypothetical protein
MQRNRESLRKRGDVWKGTREDRVIDCSRFLDAFTAVRSDTRHDRV